MIRFGVCDGLRGRWNGSANRCVSTIVASYVESEVRGV